MEDTVLIGTEYVPIASLGIAEWRNLWNFRAEEITRLRGEQLSLHRAITAHEHAEHRARMNQDRSLDQGIDLNLDMPRIG